MIKKIKLTVAQAIIKFIDQQYFYVDKKEIKIVEGVFTIYGHGIVLGIGEALTNSKHNLKVYQGKNEQGMSHIALGYTKQNLRRKILAVTSSIGPGSTNIITAAATATANNLPLLIFPADAYSNRQPDPVLQQIEFDNNFGTTVNDSFKAVSKYWDRISRPEQTMTALLNAFRVLTDPANTGAVTVCIPQDVQGETFEFDSNFFKKRIWKLERLLPSDETINCALERILKANKPLLIVGGGVTYSEATKEILDFANKFNVPYASTQAGKNAMPIEYNYNLGGIGVTGTLCANKIAKNSDLIIGIGTKYSDFTTASKSLFNEDAEFININISRRESYKLDGLALIGDARETLKALTKKLIQIKYKSNYKNEIIDSIAEWKKIKDEIINNEIIHIQDDNTEKIIQTFKNSYPFALNQTRTFELIQKAIKKNSNGSIIVGAAGSLPGDLQRLWDVEEFGTYSVEYGFSCMGFEIQAAIGAKLANPKKEVYAFVGDGSFLMLHSEILTAIQENIKINIILFDNSGFGCIDNLQVSKGINSNSTYFLLREDKHILDGNKIAKVNFSMIMEGYGGSSFQITNYEEIENIIKQAANQRIISLIEIKVLPKTMTDGYEVFWRVGNSQISDSQKVIKQTKKDNEIIRRIRTY